MLENVQLHKTRTKHQAETRHTAGSFISTTWSSGVATASDSPRRLFECGEKLFSGDIYQRLFITKCCNSHSLPLSMCAILLLFQNCSVSRSLDVCNWIVSQAPRHGALRRMAGANTLQLGAMSLLRFLLLFLFLFLFVVVTIDLSMYCEVYR